jgi:xylulokinase
MTSSGVVIGIDICTSSTKGVLIDLAGQVLHTIIKHHDVQQPNPGQVEMDGNIWWEEFCQISRELVTLSTAPINRKNASAPMWAMRRSVLCCFS